MVTAPIVKVKPKNDVSKKVNAIVKITAAPNEGVKNLGGLGEKAKSANGNVPYSNSSGELRKGTVDIMLLITFGAQE